MMGNAQFQTQPICGLEILTQVEQAEIGPLDWAIANREAIESWLHKNGALLIRGLNLDNSQQFGEFLTVIFGDELLSYNLRSTPRTAVGGNVYTATEYHPNQLIAQHNEQAYTNAWPMRIGFFCVLPSRLGGETPVADSRSILRKIPQVIRDEFAEKGVMYVRNFSNIDLPWTEVFNTEDRKEIETFCDENGIQYEWLDRDNLRTKQILPTITQHPVSKESVWFNQAHLFHVSTLPDLIREELIYSRGKDGLPRNAYYGDGSDIADETIQVIRDVYEQNKTSFVWQKGDIMLLDNMLFSHGREPFEGERTVLVGMARSSQYGGE